jgi:hypothetical protein
MPTPISITTFRDLGIAATLGLVGEAALAVLNFTREGDIAEDHPWLQISQEPGAEIAERLFRHVAHGVVPAIACTILIQTVILAALALTVIYAYRLLTVGRRGQ